MSGVGVASVVLAVGGVEVPGAGGAVAVGPACRETVSLGKNLN